MAEENILLDSIQLQNMSSPQLDTGFVPHVVMKSYYSPHSNGQFDWSTLNMDGPPSADELQRSRRKLKMLFPILSLVSLNKYVFAGETVDASGASYAEFYDSILVLGGSNHLADGMAELLNEAGLDIVSARTAALIIMLVPAQSRAIYNDITLNTKKLSFADALNHDAFKSASNQANHIVTELALPHVRKTINTKKYPGLDKMLATAVASSALAAPPLLIQITLGLIRDGNVNIGKMTVDSGVGFMYSTAVTSFKGVNQQAAHVYLDGAKDKPWCDPEQQDCEYVDGDGVFSELMAGAVCYLGAVLVDLAASALPVPVSGATGMSWLFNNGLKVAPKIMSQTSKHLRKVTAYAGSDAFNKKVKHTLTPYTGEAEAGSSVITLFTNAGLSYLSSLHGDGAPYKTGFGLKSVDAAYNLAAIVGLKIFYAFGLNHAFGLTETPNYPWDYFFRTPGTPLIYPNVEEDMYGFTPVQIIRPQDIRTHDEL